LKEVATRDDADDLDDDDDEANDDDHGQKETSQPASDNASVVSGAN